MSNIVSVERDVNPLCTRLRQYFICILSYDQWQSDKLRRTHAHAMKNWQVYTNSKREFILSTISSFLNFAWQPRLVLLLQQKFPASCPIHFVSKYLGFHCRASYKTSQALTSSKMAANVKQPLKFSKFLKSKWLIDAKDFELKKRTLIVNISNTDAIISGPPPRKVLKPRKSTILKGICIRS